MKLSYDEYLKLYKKAFQYENIPLIIVFVLFLGGMLKVLIDSIITFNIRYIIILIFLLLLCLFDIFIVIYRLIRLKSTINTNFKKNNIDGFIEIELKKMKDGTIKYKDIGGNFSFLISRYNIKSYRIKKKFIILNFSEYEKIVLLNNDYILELFEDLFNEIYNKGRKKLKNR